jgi:nucleotide-binding universal stress UspA family protein
VLVAVATAHTNEAQFEALREAVRRASVLNSQYRVACATVIRPESVVGSATEEGTATSQHIRQLVNLRHWAEPLDLPSERLTFHVLESNDPAEALLKYAKANHVDQIIIGAPPPGMPLRSVLTTVASKVMAEAPCTVTIVRSRSDA